jgi:hypothetical protein
MAARLCLVPVIWARGYGDGEDVRRICRFSLVDALLQVAIGIEGKLMLVIAVLS